MKKYKIELVTSLDNKVDIKDITVNGDSLVREENWIIITVQLKDKAQRFIVPREQVKRIEELSE